jgi:hypothetical protein
MPRDPEKERTTRRQAPKDERERPREAGPAGPGRAAEDSDAREDEGWSQPESSAQKDAEIDDSEG